MGRIIPVMGTAVPGQFETAAWWNAQVRDLGNFTLGVPVFVGYQTATQALANSTFVSMNIDTELIDTDSGHSNTTNPSRYIPQVPGTYLVVGTAAFDNTSAVGYRRARLTLNGAAIRGAVSTPHTTQAVTTAAQAAGLVTCNGSTDYVEVQGAQDSGASISTVSAADICPALFVAWVRS